MSTWEERPTQPIPAQRMAELVAFSTERDDASEFVSITWDTDDEVTQPAICLNTGLSPRFCECRQCRVVPAPETPRSW